MSQIIKYCKKCFEDPYKYAKFICDIVDTLNIQDVIENDSVGYFCMNDTEEHDYCKYHPEEKLVKSKLTSEEFHCIEQISSNLKFVQSMEQLKEKDPIEFQLKLAQFKSTTVQQESIKPQKQNIPKCPTCGSTKLSKISTMSKAGSVIMWGLFSQKVKKTWHCNVCKYEW